jgi:glyoxylase-like metal-dependent hydrolase (beta-lactamase superfamily II)
MRSRLTLTAYVPGLKWGMRISDRCYAVTGLGCSTPWCVNAGIIAGDNLTLIVDTGYNALGAQTILGYATAVRPGNKLRVINTEKHFDHICGNGLFLAHGIEVWGHAGISRTASEFQREFAEFNDGISNATRRERKEAAAFFHDTRVVNPSHHVKHNTRWDLGSCSAEILLTPGHTPTNLCVWIPDDRVLFTGDCLISEYLPNLDEGTPADWQTWLESLQRVESLNPTVVVAGHGPVLRGDQVQSAVDTVRQVLEESIARGYSPTAKRPVELAARDAST